MKFYTLMLVALIACSGSGGPSGSPDGATDSHDVVDSGGLADGSFDAVGSGDVGTQDVAADNTCTPLGQRCNISTPCCQGGCSIITGQSVPTCQ